MHFVEMVAKGDLGPPNNNDEHLMPHGPNGSCILATWDAKNDANTTHNCQGGTHPTF